MGEWIGHSQTNYSKKIHNMKDKNIYNLWSEFINNDKYKKYFISNEDLWKQNLKEVKKYIDENKQKPSSKSKDKNIKFIGSWILTSQKNYSKKINNMKDETIYKLWSDFINDTKYKDYFE